MKNLPSKALIALSAIMIIAEIFLYFLRFYVALASDLPIDYEGPTYYGVRLLSLGQNIYDSSTLAKAPFMVTIYTPLYYGISSIFQNFLDLSSGLKFCRGLSILSFFFAAYSSFRIFSWSNLGRTRSLIALFVFLNFFALWIWSNYCRVDMLATALGLFAIERFLCFESKEIKDNKFQALYLVAIALLCVAAVFTKQSCIVVPFSIFAYLLLSKNLKKCIWFSVAFGAGFALTFVFVQIITGGGFVLHMQFASKMPFDWQMMLDHLAWIGLDWLKILIIAASSLILIFLGKRVRNKEKYFSLSIPFLISTLFFTLYTLGTEYPNTNHAILFYFTLVWLFAQISDEFRGKKESKQEYFYSISLVSACLLSCALMTQLIPVMLAWPDQLKQAKSNLAVLSEVKKQSIIFTEDPYLSLISNTKPLFVDVSTFVQVWHGLYKDKWQKRLESMVGQKDFDAVIVNCHDDQKEKPSYYWSDDLIDLIHHKYSLKSTVVGNRQDHNLYLKAK